MSISRRALLATAASSMIVTDLPTVSAAELPGAYSVTDQDVSKQARRLKLKRGDRFVAALLYSSDYPTHFRLKPELHTVCTPAGLPVTGSFEYCFIHHQSIMCGHGKVHVESGPPAHDRLDFYRHLPFPDPGRADKFHKDYDLYNLGPSGMQHIVEAKWTTEPAITLNLKLSWETRVMGLERGEPIVLEDRRYRIEQRGDMTIVDQASRLRPAGGNALVLQADRHSLHGVRVHDLIDVDDGGTMTDSLGRVNPSGNYWDAAGKTQAPRWVDCTGRIGTQTAGVTLMAHPANVRNEWYVREFGLMEVSPTLGHDQRVTADEPLVFSTRYVAHDGVLAPATADQLLDEFAATPVMEE